MNCKDDDFSQLFRQESRCVLAVFRICAEDYVRGMALVYMALHRDVDLLVVMAGLNLGSRSTGVWMAWVWGDDTGSPAYSKVQLPVGGPCCSVAELCVTELGNHRLSCIFLTTCILKPATNPRSSTAGPPSYSVLLPTLNNRQ
mgnify:CR=1 FL=1